MKRIHADVRDKQGKVVGKLDYQEPESLTEATGAFGEEKVLAGFKYWLNVAKRKEATKLPPLDKELLKQLKKNPELLGQLKERLGVE